MAPSLAEFVRTHKQEYAAILPICYYFSTTIFTALSAPEKCILIPTAHPEKPLYYSTYSHIFTRVAHIAFNTVSEQRLCRRIFGRHMAPSSIVGVGIETAESLPWDSVREKFGLPERYVLYVGAAPLGEGRQRGARVHLGTGKSTGTTSGWYSSGPAR